ncbi:MAG: hypothetical protein ACR5LF_10400 [Symbiopectobacterium sp.]
MWDILLLVLYFVIVDTIERHLLFAFLFIYNAARTDLLEELFELPFMFSLLAIAFLLQRNESRPEPKQCQFHILHCMIFEIRLL